MYYNTTQETGETLKSYTDKNLKQQDRVIAFFKSRPEMSFSPSEVWNQVFKHSCPLTSVRRAMTDLTSMGELKRLDTKKTGAYGRPEHFWKLV